MNANITLAQEWIAQADAILIGASNGLSIAEGYHIFANNEMFRRQFGDMQQQYGFRNIVEGLYFQYPTAEARLEFHRRLVKFWVEDYQPSQVMHNLMKVIDQKDYFILTSNGDLHLEKSGFDEKRIFEIEGVMTDLFAAPAPKKKTLFHHFLTKYSGKKLVILELGIGSRNRLIKLPIMQLAYREPNAKYITLNMPQELYIPEEIAEKSVGIAGDIAQSFKELNTND